MIKARPWNGKDLKGTWEFTLKIDGVRALWRDGRWVSRAGKPLYNIPPLFAGAEHLEEGVEVYLTAPGRSSKENYKATIECVRAKTKDRPIPHTALYMLAPLDPRLRHSYVANPTAELIQECLDAVVSRGYEGLVLRQGNKWLKVKPVETYDVPVTGIIEGSGKHKGRMGALMTPMGKVGTGFTDKEREWWWDNHYIADDDEGTPMFGMSIHPCGEDCPGQEDLGETPCCEYVMWEPVIEVSCMQLTPDGKFRHPRFERIRHDK